MRLDETLNKISNIKKQGDGFTGKCPGHDDKQNSLSITEGLDGRVLLHCHAGCSTEKIVEVMGLKVSDLFPDKEPNGRKQVAEYPYKDLAGNIVHKTIRFEPKGFTQCRPDGKGGWIYNLKDIKPILYNLQRVTEAISKGETVYVAEGEKDCDNMGKLSLAATTSPMGAGKWQDHYSDYLINANTVIIPDNDAVGKSHSEQIAKSLQGKAKSIKIIDLTKGLPELPQKGDITDFFRILGKIKGLEFLKRLVDNTEEWELQEMQQEEPQEPWEAPIPFDNFNLPSFPTNCFPDWVAEYIEAVAEDTQTPEDMAAVVALGILSVPCNKIYKVEGKPGWQEPTNLFSTVIAKPGERKSAIMAHMTKPIYEYEAEESERLKSDIARNQAEKKILEGESNKLQAVASKDNTALNRAAALDKAEELSKFEDISQARLTCDDISPEKLAGLLADHNGRMAIVSAEGGIFDIMSGRYSQGTNIDVFLKGHAGDPLRVDRIGRSSEYISEPALSMSITIQPDVLTGIMSNSSFRGRGLTARFLYSIPSSKVGARSIECKSLPEYVKSAYCRNIRALLDIKVPETPYILKLSHEAYKLSIEFAKELEPRLIDDLEHIADWASKLHGAILRIAGILHVTEHADQRPWEYDISAGTLHNASMVGRYFIEHAKAAFALMGADKNVDECKYVLRWIEKQGQSELKKRDILRGNRRFKNVEELEPILKALCEYGYLKEFGQQRDGAVKIFDKSYKVNPLISSPISKDTRDTQENYDSVSHVSHVSHKDTTSKNVIQDDALTEKNEEEIDYLRGVI